MIKQQYWKYFIYLVMALYVTYVASSLYYINALVQEGQNYAITANHDIEDIRARARELTASLPVLLASGELPLEDLQQEMAVSTENQQKSFENLKEHFRGNPESIAGLEKILAALADSKRSAASRLEGNNSYELALAYYRNNLAPLLNDLQAALNQVYQSVDATRNEIHEKMHQQLNLVIISTIIAGFIIVFITIVYDRRAAASSRKLAYRDELFKLLGNAVDEIFLITCGSNYFEYITPNCSRLLGYTTDDLKKNPDKFYELLNSDDADWLKKNLLNPPASGQHLERDLRNSGGNRFFRAQIFTIRVPSTRQTRTIIVLNDQTETRLHQLALSDALENAHAASDAKSSFLSHMSHEIRTPMNAIIGMTTIALSRMSDKTRVEDCLFKISDSSKHLLRLINDVLDMSKIESGKLTISNDKFNLHRAVDNIQNTFRPLMQAKKHNFKIQLINVEEEELIGDAMRLDQILINILSNAVKFTPADGSITMEIEQLKKMDASVQLRFTITDTGIGMSPEFLKRIYIPFEQAHASMASKYGGTGLGMPITANLVAMMGGTIDIRSQEGKGSAFTIVLPFGLGANSAGSGQPALPKLNILIIDDDEAAARQAGLGLQKFGLVPAYAFSAAAAKAMVAEAHNSNRDFQIILAKWNMPDSPAPELIRNIEEITGKDKAVFIISSYDPASIEEEARQAGFNYLISQPFFVSSLSEVICEATQSRAAPHAQAPAEQQKTYDFSGKRILLAEDNEFNREIAQEFLEMVNADVDFAENGREALDKFLASAPGTYDMILMDIQMPVMDGYEAARQIRASAHNDAKSINIIAMTANAFNEDIAKAMAAGMNAHIAKPIDIKLLYAMLAEYFRAPRV